MRLRKLVIHRFRNVKPGTTLEFHDEINLVLGRNASGKTTLLNIIAAVTSDDFSAFEKEPEGYDFEWEFALGAPGVENGSVCITRFGRSPSQEGDTEAGEPLWVHALRMELVVAGESFGVITSDLASVSFNGRGPPNTRVVLQLLSTEIRPARAIRFAFMNQDGAPHVGWNTWYAESRNAKDTLRFDEALASFDQLVNEPLTFWGFEGESRIRGVGAVRLHPLVRGDELLDKASFDHFGDGAHPLRTPKSPKQILDFDTVDISPLIEERTLLTDGALEIQIKSLRFRFHRGASSVTQDQLSFGQKRMFALCQYLAVRRAPYVLDEPANGLHYAWIREMFKQIEGRQTFIATQHPFLLDLVPVVDEASVRKGFIRCEAKADGTMAWRNFDEAESKRLIEAYDTGVPQLSEVLLMENLW